MDVFFKIFKIIDLFVIDVLYVCLFVLLEVFELILIFEYNIDFFFICLRYLCVRYVIVDLFFDFVILIIFIFLSDMLF